MQRLKIKDKKTSGTFYKKVFYFLLTTAIFAQYIVRLVEVGKKKDYLPWLRKNINEGWGNRDRTRNLVGKDYTHKLTSDEVVSCYDACGIPALMLLVPIKD